VAASKYSVGLQAPTHWADACSTFVHGPPMACGSQFTSPFQPVGCIFCPGAQQLIDSESWQWAPA
jgi:hypothetical protein